jgi:hypothetical protein
MPIDSSIALGVKPVQIESPLNQMANVYALQNAQQSNQLNQMKMEEYKRGLTEDEAIKNYFATQDRSSPDFLKGLYSVSPKLGQAYEKLQSETSKEKSLSEKARIEKASSKQKFLQDALRSISKNPSNENITAYGQDAVLNGIMSAEEAKANVDRLLTIPVEQRQAFLASQGASASDLKPNIQMQNLGGSSNVLSIPAFGGDPTVLSTTPMGISPEAQQRIALEKDRVNLEKRRVDIAEKTSAPGYVKPLSETQQYKLDKLKAADKANAALFESSIDAEIKNIDKLIGSEAKPELHPGLTSAVGPVSSRLPTVSNKAGNAEALIKSLQSKASINSLQTIRGTAGAVGTLTEREWPRLESMKATLQESQSPDQFVTSLVDYRKELQNMKLKAKEALNTDYSAAIGASVPSANPNVDALLEKYK